jgi:hypothetical protein
MKRIVWPLALVLAIGLTSQVNSAAKSGGVIKVSTAGLVLEVKGPDGRPVSIPANKDVPAPTGTYPTVSLTQYAKDSSGVWSIQSKGPFGSVKTISVDDGQTTSVDAGAPLTVKTSVMPTKDKTGAPVVSINLQILGKANEVYSAATVKRGMIVAPAPKVQILDEDGKTLASGSFEYG